MALRTASRGLARRAGRRSLATEIGERRDTGTGAFDANTWDMDVQTFHGGQDWAHLDNFKEDFSVTTNTVVGPMKARAAAAASVNTTEHYPSADFEPAFSKLQGFIWPETGTKYESQFMMGNGASELIDLVVRSSLPQDGAAPAWKPGGTLTQYKEYERSSKAQGMVTKDAAAKDVQLTCIVNPCNPTGDYIAVGDMMNYIEEHVPDGTTVMVDESMQPWHGPEWRCDSLTNNMDWIKAQYESRDVKVWIMHSWTKIWSCAGLRLGSVIGPDPAIVAAVRKKQVPWSLNTCAIAFCAEAVDDVEYLEDTWAKTPAWRKLSTDVLSAEFPQWSVHGEPWLSWIWIDTKDAELTEKIVVAAKANGTPVRTGAAGYNMPTFFRMAVRSPENTADFWECIRGIK